MSSISFKHIAVSAACLVFLPLWQVPAWGQNSAGVTVNDTVNSTLNYYRTIKAIQENRQAALHEVRRAEAGWGPRVDMEGRAGTEYLSDSTTRVTGSDKFEAAGSVGATLSQPLWDGRATRNRVFVSEARVRSLDKRLLDNATTYALESIIAHIDLLRRQQLVSLAQDNVKRHQRILSMQQQRTNVGASTSADVSQTQGRLARAQSTLYDAEGMLRAAEANYLNLTGVAAPANLLPVPMPATMYATPQTVIDDVKTNNPKIAAYLADIQMAEGEKELSKSNFQPNVNVEVGPRYSNRGGPGSQWRSSVDAMMVLRWNIYNSGADVALVKASAARKRQTTEEMFNLMDTLDKEVRITWAEYVSAQEQEASYAKAVGYAKRTVNEFNEQFMLGQRSLLDVLDSQSELFNSSTQEVTNASNVLVGAYRLYALAGQLFPLLNIDPGFLYMDTAQYAAQNPGSED